LKLISEMSINENPYIFNYDEDTCYIFPRSKIPNGTLLTFDNCPEAFNQTTPKLVKFCCFMIIYEITQKSSYKIVQDFMRDYGSTVLLPPAVLFNILSLMVLRNLTKKGSRTSTNHYMMYLCTMDLLTIFAKFFHETVVVRNAIREHPIVITDFVCKFTSFFESVCSITSIYLLIAMSIDKLICVLIPLKVSQLLTPSKARIIFIVIFIISSVFSSYELFAQHSVELRVNRTEIASPTATAAYSPIGYDCDTKWPELQKEWLMINNIMKVFVPIVILCVCNSWIVISLSKSKKSAMALVGNREKEKYNFVSTKKSPVTIRLKNMGKEGRPFVSCENLTKCHKESEYILKFSFHFNSLKFLWENFLSI
jgi:hypothetical protein